MAKSKKQTKAKTTRATSPAHAMPPPDNPFLRQQDHLFARLSGNVETKPAKIQADSKMTGTLAVMDVPAPRRRQTSKTNLAAERLTALKAMHAMSLTDGVLAPVIPSTSNWVQLGPTAIPNGQTYGGARVLVTGRVNAIAVDPSNHQIIYIGAARGGIWKTTDGGRTWAPKSDNEVSLAIGALAIARSNPQVLYVGTGEGNLQRYVQSYTLNSSPDNYLGNGVLKSTNGGNSWTQQGAAQFVGAGFYRIAVHPTNADIAFAATSNGLYRTTNGGTTWSRLTNGLPAISATVIAATDVAIDPNNPNNVFCAFFAGGVYKTANGTAANPTWTRQSSALPSGASSGRIAVAISPSAPSTVYAVISDTAESIQGIYRTTTGGGTWSSLGLTVGGITGSSSYTLDLQVDPTTPDIIYISGTSLFRATRNSMTGSWSLSEIGANIHPDNHCFTFDPTSHSTIYAGTDGGIYMSTNSGTSWSDTINRGPCITQYEMIDQHPTSEAVVIGGTQDNGTEQYRNSPVFYHSDDGDGGFVGIDQNQPRNMLHTYYSRSLARSTQAGRFGLWFDASGGLAGNPLFYPPFALDQTNPNNIAYGTDRICLDSSQGTGGWSTIVSLPGITQRVSAICYVNSNLIYAGTSTGQLYKLVKSGTTWSATAIHAAPLPSRWIWDIATRPGSVNTIIVGVAGFGTGHVWRGTVPATGAATWTNISGTGGGQLPNIPVNSLVVDPLAADTIYVGSDIGVFRTTNGGMAWMPFTQGLPNCAIYDLKLHNATRLLRAGTHGRGLWEKKLDVTSIPDVNIFVRDDLMESGRAAASSSGTTAGFEDPLQNVGLGDTLYWYMCADIKVDALDGAPPTYQMSISDVDYVAFESKLQHRNARRGNVNRVYVQVHNRGIQPATNVTVKLLFANASAGLPPLPSDFWTAFPANSANTSIWTPIGSPRVIPAISPTEPALLEWDWTTPMSAADHTCLLVICDCPADPIPGASKVLNVNTLVPSERHVGLKNLHIVNMLAGTMSWEPFQFYGNIESSQTIRIPSSLARTWQLGLMLQANTPQDLKLTGFTPTKPTDAMLTALKEKIGEGVARYDTSVIYMLDSLQKGGILDAVKLAKSKYGGLLQTMLLLIAPKTTGAKGNITILQEQDQKVLVGGSTFAVQTVKAFK